MRIDIIVVPRDRFSTFPRCIDAIFANTPMPFRLIVAAGGPDPATRLFLRDLERTNDNVMVVMTDRLLLQGEARNIGLREASTRWCVVLENDTIVGQDWLPPLLNCMQDEGAAVVSPIILWYRGVHAAGCGFDESTANGTVVFRHHIDYATSGRRRIDYPECHCILMDRASLPEAFLFDDVEPFDVDLGLALRKFGLAAFVEPRSVVTYAAPPPLEVRDIPAYRFRWDPDAWAVRNRQFVRKWRVAYDPSAKLASYRRQQLKLGLARWHANWATVALSNFVVRASQRLLSAVMRGGSWGHAPQRAEGASSGGAHR